MLIFDQLRRNDRPLQVISVGVLAGLGILLAGLWYVQVVSAKRFRADQQDQSFRTVRVPAIRGKILDRNGEALAENRPSYNINLYLEELRRQFHYEYTNYVKPNFTRTHPQANPSRQDIEQLEREARFRVVSNYLGRVSSAIHEPRFLIESAFHKHYSQQRSLPFTLWHDLNYDQMARFVENTPDWVSLSLDVQPIRIYPHTSLAAHLLGYLRRNDNPADDEDINYQFRMPDYVGVRGIEWAFDDELRGKAAAKMVLVNRMGYRQSEETWTASEPGANVVLTIDVKIQEAAEKALQSVFEHTRGAVVVMDPNTGEILAMASAPTFDPNQFIRGFTEEEWANSKMLDPELKPLFNRAAYGAYHPGSIFKVIVGLACLEAGAVDADEIYKSPGIFRLPGRRWRDTAPPGDYDFRRAFYLSSNSYFQNYGLKAGPKKIVEMGRRFGLGEPTGLDKGQEASGYFPKPDKLVKRYDGGRWLAGDTANLCIGQGEVTVTPLQMAVMTAAIANGGKILEPRIVTGVKPQGRKTGEKPAPPSPPQIRRTLRLNPQHVALIKQAMWDDVHTFDRDSGRYATGHAADVDGMSVCGKTGTAQVEDEFGRLKEHITWFISFAPFESPRYAVAAVVEGGGSGGGTCGPVVRRIYEALLKRERANSNRGG